MHKYFNYSNALIVALIGLLVYVALLPERVPTGLTVEATQAPELKKQETKQLDIDSIQVFSFQTKSKLGLPSEVQSNSKKHVVASSKVKGDSRPHTITTVIDESTGEFATYDRAYPLPWVAVVNTTHIGAYYGIKNGTGVVRLQGQQEILKLKAVTVEATVSADFGNGSPDTFIGIGARVSF